MDVASGTVVDRKYEVLAPLAEGGMGSVYRARHVLTEEVVALKVLTVGPSDMGQARRFKLEVSVAAKVKHPAIVKMYDAGIELDTGRFYLAMELLEGRSLRDAMVDGESSERLLRWIVEAAEAMAAAHAMDVVHRDLKPDNLFVERGPGGEHVRLLDFGIARDLSSPSVTTTGVAVGTALYMAPEQATASKEIGPAADVWAFGAMIYEILTGHRPFDGPSAHAVVVDAVTKPHEAIESHRPDLEEGWGELVDACLAKKPEQRPSTSELASALRTLIQSAQVLGSAIPLVRSRPYEPSEAPALASESELAATEAVASVAGPGVGADTAEDPLPALPDTGRQRVWLGLGAAVVVVGGALAWAFAGPSADHPAPEPTVTAPAAPVLEPEPAPEPVVEAPPEPTPRPTRPAPRVVSAPPPTRTPTPAPAPPPVRPAVEPQPIVAPASPVIATPAARVPAEAVPDLPLDPTPAPPSEPPPAEEGRGVLQGVDAFDRQSGRRRR